MVQMKFLLVKAANTHSEKEDLECNWCLPRILKTATAQNQFLHLDNHATTCDDPFVLIAYVLLNAE